MQRAFRLDHDRSVLTTGQLPLLRAYGATRDPSVRCVLADLTVDARLDDLRDRLNHTVRKRLEVAREPLSLRGELRERVHCLISSSSASDAATAFGSM